MLYSWSIDCRLRAKDFACGLAKEEEEEKKKRNNFQQEKERKKIPCIYLHSAVVDILGHSSRQIPSVQPLVAQLLAQQMYHWASHNFSFQPKEEIKYRVSGRGTTVAVVQLMASQTSQVQST